MNKKLWNENTNTAVLNYISSTDSTEKNKIYTTDIYPKLINLIDIVLKKTKIQNNEENKQDLLVKSLVILDHIKEEQIKTSQEYIYRGLFNTALGYYKKKTNSLEYRDEFKEDSLINNDIDIELDETKKEIREQIINAIDNKIKSYRVLNKSGVIFLLHLKEYLINNDFDVMGFDVHCMKSMNISISQFRNLCCMNKIPTKVLRQKLINE